MLDSRYWMFNAGGRDEETYSKYARGIRKNKYPSSRQHKQTPGQKPGLYIIVQSVKLKKR